MTRAKSARADVVMTEERADPLAWVDRYFEPMTHRNPGDITGRELAERRGVTLNTAQRILNDRWKKGELERYRVHLGTAKYNWTYAYRPKVIK